MVNNFQAQELSVTAWVFAIAGQLNELQSVLCTSMARRVEGQLNNFGAQNVASRAWAFAAVGQADIPLLLVLAWKTKQFISDFTVQELTNTAWGFAAVGLQDSTLFA
eukprot:gnl/MRDRNA2_/MRDRNA2_223457_c0_seq1.p2 gnl/MRDRNA2_/MRDRNA2_223457_c0~~gnl/MRDRNA2_/MRDRNA2_223457_c0_seq1.p2  ORF type:complete len:107 (+),score=21.67 gnl/MRDRNA2_/MRDRNA2_223457_c0_seq1:55-375(+)